MHVSVKKIPDHVAIQNLSAKIRVSVTLLHLSSDDSRQLHLLPVHHSVHSADVHCAPLPSAR